MIISRMDYEYHHKLKFVMLEIGLQVFDSNSIKVITFFILNSIIIEYVRLATARI